MASTRVLVVPAAELYGIQRVEYLDDVLVLCGAGVGGGLFTASRLAHRGTRSPQNPSAQLPSTSQVLTVAHLAQSGNLRRGSVRAPVESVLVASRWDACGAAVMVVNAYRR